MVYCNMLLSYRFISLMVLKESSHLILDVIPAIFINVLQLMQFAKVSLQSQLC